MATSSDTSEEQDRHQEPTHSDPIETGPQEEQEHLHLRAIVIIPFPETIPLDVDLHIDAALLETIGE